LTPAEHALLARIEMAKAIWAALVDDEQYHNASNYVPRYQRLTRELRELRFAEERVNQ
jgi:hypothetical protein